MGKISKAVRGVADIYNGASLIVRIIVGLIIGTVLALTMPHVTWIGEFGTLFVAALKAAEPWLFADGGTENGGHDEETAGTTGLKPAGSDGTAATVARWERLAGLSDDEGKE